MCISTLSIQCVTLGQYVGRSVVVITYAKEVMVLLFFVFVLFLRGGVCLSAGLCKNYWPDIHVSW